MTDIKIDQEATFRSKVVNDGSLCDRARVTLEMPIGAWRLLREKLCNGLGDELSQEKTDIFSDQGKLFVPKQ